MLQNLFPNLPPHPVQHSGEKEGLFETKIFLGPQVQKMLVVRNSMESEPKLAILTPSAVTAIPLSRCDAVVTCARCVALQDPYCAWDVRREVCASLHAVAKMDSTNYLQGWTRFNRTLKGSRMKT